MSTSIRRDLHSNAILNTDQQALNKYKSERLYYRKVDKLQSDICEIKETIIRMCEKIDQLEKK